MNKRARRVGMVLALIFAATIAAARQDAHARHEEMEKQSWNELTASMHKMHTAMEAAKPSGNSDEDFVRLMLSHHEAAIDMARAELQYGKDPQIRRLAQEIVTDQQSEIELMKLWLKQRKTPQG